MKRFLALLLCVFGSLAASSPAEVELSLDFYYDQLSPHGEWAEVEGYGQVWHPAGVDDDWAPYSDGYWTYTDAGWTWVSYEDWGGICYHYGRWARIADYGWCWVPGYEWGPAWVSWRKSDEYVGWAPLPPECDWEEDRGVGVWVDVSYDIGPRYYNFCRIRDFGAPVIRHVLFPRIRNVDICFSTVNITNISYNRGYGCVYNGGFDYDYIRERCERPIPTLKLVQNTTNIFINNNGGNVFVNAPRGNALVVAAPRVATNYRQFTRKPAALRSFRRDAVVRGWTGVDQAETRERLVSKMREETKGLTPTNAPARPVRQEALAVVPKQVDLDARPTGLRRQTAERPSRAAAAAAQIPVDSAAITTPSREGRIGKMRPERGETAEKPTSSDRPERPERPVGPTDRPATDPRGRGSDAPIASKEESTGGLRKRPGRVDGDGNQPATSEPARGRVGVEDRGNEVGKPERMVDPRENSRVRRAEQEAPVNGNKPNRAAEMREDAQERAARQGQENAVKERAVRENADRQLKQREQAEAAQDAAERAQRQRSAEMQRDAQESANRAARENAVRENAARENVENARRAQEMRNADNAARAERQRQANDQAEAAQRQAAQRAAAERQLENQRRQSMERQADAQRERAAAQQNEARQRQMEAARERANDAQRERAMDVQRERAAAAQAQQNEARQRQAEAARENAMNAQRERAAAAQAQQRAAAQAEAQQQRAAAQAQQRAAAQAQAQQQQRAAAQAQAQQQRGSESRGSNSGSDEDPRKKRNR